MSAAALGLMLAGAGAAKADTGDPLYYFGGPVVHSVQGVVVDWGSGVNSVYTNETTGDPGLIKYLAASSGSAGDVSGVLAQYMDSSGANAAPQVTYGGQYPITPSVTSNTVYDWQIQRELVSQINTGTLPRPAAGGLGTVYLVLFPAGHTECMDRYTCSGQEFCAYHGNAQLSDGTPVLYAVLPDNTTGGMSQGCGNAGTALANQTSYTSHEWSEAITDPLVAEATSNASPLAWYDANCPTESSLCGEIGDKCNAEQALNGGWTVQLEWSNLDSTCESSEPTYSSPTAAFVGGGPGAVAGQAVSFDGSGSSDPPSDHTTIRGTSYAIQSGIATYAWNWGDSTTSVSGATPTHTFAAPGTYQVSLTVTDDLGFTSTVTHAVEVSSANPSAPSAVTGLATGVDTQDATMAGTIDTGGQPVSYSFAYGTSAGDLNKVTPPAHLGPGTGPVPVSATVGGLLPATTYYYQLDVVASGQTYSGNAGSFTTAAVANGGGTQGLGTNGVEGSGGTGTGSQGGTTGTQGGSTGTGSQGGSTGTQGGSTGTGSPGGSAGSGSSGGGSQGSGGTPSPVPPPSPSPAKPQLPTVTTGAASAVSSSTATVAGAVDPNGTQTSYLVEFGTSTAYGHSSVPASAGAGTSSVPVQALLSGLRPRTTYHYRVVATSSAGTAVAADRTFRTSAAPAHAPRFSFAAPARMTLAQALAGRLRVRFHCSTACLARFTVTIALPGIKRVLAIPVTFARGSGRVVRSGSGTATLTFTRGARRALRGARTTRLVISGYAVRAGSVSAPSPPRTARLTLTR